MASWDSACPACPTPTRTCLDVRAAKRLLFSKLARFHVCVVFLKADHSPAGQLDMVVLDRQHALWSNRRFPQFHHIPQSSTHLTWSVFCYPVWCKVIGGEATPRSGLLPRTLSSPWRGAIARCSASPFRGAAQRGDVSKGDPRGAKSFVGFPLSQAYHQAPQGF